MLPPAPTREILRQVRELVAAGYREVTLLGQTVNSYRWPSPESEGGEVSFAELLRSVARIDGLERVGGHAAPSKQRSCHAQVCEIVGGRRGVHRVHPGCSTR